MTSSRDQAICERRATGATLQEIADEFGVTRERVRQILVKVGGTSANAARSQRQHAREQRATTVRLRVSSDVEEHPGSTVDEVAQRLQMSMAAVNAALTPATRRLLVREPPNYDQTWSDVDMLAAIRQAATYAFPLTASEYARLVGCGEVDGPSLPSVGNRFGSWTAACRAANVEHGEPFRRDYQSTWTDGDLTAFVAEYLLDERYPGTYDGYARWRRDEQPDAPSAPTVRNRLGPWGPLKRRLLVEIRTSAERGEARR